MRKNVEYIKSAIVINRKKVRNKNEERILKNENQKNE